MTTSVRKQIREAHASLSAMIENRRTPIPSLADGYGGFGKLLMAADYPDAAEPCATITFQPIHLQVMCLKHSAVFAMLATLVTAAAPIVLQDTADAAARRHEHRQGQA